MPGYLTQLAARFFGAKPAVRPRLPSLFESVPGAMMLAEPERRVPPAVEQERLAPHIPPALHPAPSMHHERPLPERLEPSEAPRRQIVAQSSSLRTADAEMHTLAVPAPAPTRPLPPANEPAEAAAPLPFAPIVLHPELRPMEAKQFPALHHEPASPEAAQSKLKPQPSAPVEQAWPIRLQPQPEEPRLLAPVRPLTEPVHSSQPALRTLTPLVQAQPEPRSAPRPSSFPNAAPVEASTVQVTIGRLIVEAVVPTPPPTPVATSRSPVPRLSLDDYLRQRRSDA